MLLKYFYNKKLAQASYMVGCVKTGEALIVDPARDIQQYLAAAAEEGLRITHVTETHIHADFVSGSRELAAASNATLFLSNMGDASWQYGYANDPNVILVEEGDSWMVGNIKVDVLHTPGHTPEHISFMITDTAGADKPIGVFTGDFIFVGDVGRPDLLEEAAGLVGTAENGAHLQYQSVARFKELPDYLQIWPGHGAGSACGKALGAIPSTTLGYEKLFNPAFQFDDEVNFSQWLLQDQPAAPRYFAQMKKVNKSGPALLDELAEPTKMNRAMLDDLVQNGALIVDLRDRDSFAMQHIQGTVSIPATNSAYSTYVGWFVEYDRPIYFVTPSAEAVSDIVASLHAIGVDNIPGYFMPDVIETDVTGADVVGTNTVSLPQLSARELAQRLPQNGIQVIDVRGEGEFAEEHIAGATNIVLGHLPKHFDLLSKETPLIMQCASGYRAQIAASLLRANGFKNAMLMGEPKSSWSTALPTESIK